MNKVGPATAGQLGWNRGSVYIVESSSLNVIYFIFRDEPFLLSTRLI